MVAQVKMFVFAPLKNFSCEGDDEISFG